MEKFISLIILNYQALGGKKINSKNFDEVLLKGKDF